MYVTPRIELSDEPVMTLQTLLEVHSPEILKDHRKLKDILIYNDKEGEFNKEIYLLSISMIANIPEQILAHRNDFARIFYLLVQQLQCRFLIEERAAQWAVSSWAKALEITKHSQKRRVDNMGPRIKSKRHYNDHVDRSGVIMWNTPLTRN